MPQKSLLPGDPTKRIDRFTASAISSCITSSYHSSEELNICLSSLWHLTGDDLGRIVHLKQITHAPTPATLPPGQGALSAILFDPEAATNFQVAFADLSITSLTPALFAFDVQMSSSLLRHSREHFDSSHFLVRPSIPPTPIWYAIAHLQWPPVVASSVANLARWYDSLRMLNQSMVLGQLLRQLRSFVPISSRGRRSSQEVAL
ncbi:hypothetical protein KVT40_009209 [Elsinoe batatas]|uniref:Uncharacterized protein n=1 Tax=Elsinoe batatas TaxID=2601811 RepID=A0A8K0PBW1_9PEZI|nr:hypothetical protein KVT40_009209 [Elsinoe batatas]